MTGANVTSFSSGNTLVDCNIITCLPPGPQTGLYCNPNIVIVDADQNGDSYVSFETDAMSSEDPCILIDGVPEFSNYPNSQCDNCVVVIDESFLTESNTRLDYEYISASTTVTDLEDMLNISSLTDRRRLAALAALDSPRYFDSVDSVRRAPEVCTAFDGKNKAECVLEGLRLKPRNKKLHPPSSLRKVSKPNSGNALEFRDVAQITRRQFGIAALKTTRKYGSQLDTIRQTQRLAFLRESKMSYYYSRRCASNGNSDTYIEERTFDVTQFNLTAYYEDDHETRLRRLSEAITAPSSISVPASPPPSPPCGGSRTNTVL